MTRRVFLWLLLGVGVVSAEPKLHCEQERYYAGDTAVCTLEPESGLPVRSGQVWRVDWQVLGKTFKREERFIMKGETEMSIEAKLPRTLKREVPLEIVVRRVPHAEDSALVVRKKIKVAPKQAAYWVNPLPYRALRVGLIEGSPTVFRELARLGLFAQPVVTHPAQLVSLREYDVTLDGKAFSEMNFRSDPNAREALLKAWREACLPVLQGRWGGRLL